MSLSRSIPPAVVRNPPVVLLVDEDEAFRIALSEHLREDGYPVIAHSTPIHVPPLDGLGKVGLVVTDYEMSGEDGLSFASRFHVAHPRVPVVLFTASRTKHLAAEVLRRSFLHLCHKPLDYFSFRTLLQDLLGALTR